MSEAKRATYWVMGKNGVPVLDPNVEPVSTDALAAFTGRERADAEARGCRYSPPRTNDEASLRYYFAATTRDDLLEEQHADAEKAAEIIGIMVERQRQIDRLMRMLANQ